MDVLAKNEGKIYATISIDGAGEFASPFRGACFPCLIWDHEGRFTDSERSAVARALLESGCRYAVCGGKASDDWHAAVDLEFVRQHLADSEEARDAVHVMTSSHDGQSPDDVVFFFVLNTNFDYHDFRQYLVLHVGTGDTKEQVEGAVRKWALGHKAV